MTNCNHILTWWATPPHFPQLSFIRLGWISSFTIFFVWTIFAIVLYLVLNGIHLFLSLDCLFPKWISSSLASWRNCERTLSILTANHFYHDPKPHSGFALNGCATHVLCIPTDNAHPAIEFKTSYLWVYKYSPSVTRLSLFPSHLEHSLSCETLASPLVRIAIGEGIA